MNHCIFMINHLQEISTNDGILLKKGQAIFISEMSKDNTGTLSLVHYINNVLCIEWKPNDFLIADADTQEQDDWSVVDTIVRRHRTASECLAFNTSPIPNSGATGNNATANGGGGCASLSNRKVVRAKISDLKHIEVLKNGHIVRLVQKSDGKLHSEYFFQHGNADGFVRTLQTTHCLRRSRANRNIFEIVDNDISYDREKLQKTFAELKIEDIKGTGGWISNMVKNPIGQTMDFFAKMSDAYTVIQNVGQELSGGDLSSLSPTRKTDGGGGGRTISVGGASSTTTTTSNTEDYEMLGTSPRQDSECSSTTDTQNNAAAGNNGQLLDNHRTNLAITPLPPRPKVTRGSPLTAKQWCEFMTEDGRISDSERVKEIIFRGGIVYSLRNEVWKYLLGYLRWDDTREQRIEHRRQKIQEYYKMKLQWLSMSPEQERNFSDFRDRKCQVEKDVKRTDRTIDFFAGDDNPNVSLLQDILMTYIMYNFDLGYVQGMSDLLAPILCIMENEADAFWCFVGFMDMVYVNFDMDQAGMKRQLNDLNTLISIANPILNNYFKAHDSENMYFCFRWLLVWFKREFSHTDIMELWEILWTGMPITLTTKNFHLFISVAILDDQMNIFIDNHYEFNEILKHVNELSYKIDLHTILKKAESIYLQIRSADYIPDNVRLIIGEKLLKDRLLYDEKYDDTNNDDNDIDENDDDDEYDENFDDIQIDRKDDPHYQRKIDEACERSMYNSFY